MYRHCIYCSADLGANDTLEAFPVGRTVAFDAAKGRLWAVCRRCARWNLAPIEERWEAVEDAERRFAGSRLRVQAENIGVAKTADGTRLVRIGAALPNELAAWRYGSQLVGRHRRATLLSLGVGLTGAVAYALPPFLPAAAVLAGPLWWAGGKIVRAARQNRVVHRVRVMDGEESPTVLRRRHLSGGWLKHDGTSLVLGLSGAPGMRFGRMLVLEGDDARRVVEKTMLLVNRQGAHPRQLERAVGALADAGDAEDYIRRVLGDGRLLAPVDNGIAAEFDGAAGERDTPTALLGTEALAFEMALHDEHERRALEGELTLLESAWREAEEIAAIADRLAAPAEVG